MTRAMPSDALLHRALVAYERLAQAVDGAGDPELGLATTFACGRRALRARAEAEAWLVPPTVVAQVDRLIERMTGATENEIGTWLHAFPNRLLALLERRTPGSAGPRAPQRRWVDRVLDRRPTPSSLAGITR